MLPLLCVCGRGRRGKGEGEPGGPSQLGPLVPGHKLCEQGQVSPAQGVGGRGPWQGEPFGKTGEDTQSKVVSIDPNNMIQITKNSITTMKTGLQ